MQIIYNIPHSMADNDITLLDFSRAAWSDRALIAVIVGAFAVISVVITLMLPERFRAEAAIMKATSISATASSGAMLARFSGLASLAGANLSQFAGEAGHAVPVLKSRMLLEQFIERNDLLPILFADDWDAGRKQWLDPDDPPTAWLAVRMFQESILQVREDIVTGLVFVTIDWANPKVAADWANGLVALTNEIVRHRDRATAERNIEFLNKEIERTNIMELRRVLYSLIETQMQTLMLANANPEYAFTVIDPAVAPEKRVFPQRALLVIAGTFFGGFIALLVVLMRVVVRLQQARESAA